MVFDKIENYTRYLQLSKNIRAALEFLYEHKDDTELEDGKYEIVPDQVVAYVVSKFTVSAEEVDMEIHRKFMDIHYMLIGQEKCGLVEKSSEVEKAEYDEKSDIAFFKTQNSNEVVISQGEFYAVWPYEPHRPLSSVGNFPEKVKKIICKVLM